MADPDAHVIAPTATVPPGMDRAAIEALIAKHYTGLRLLIQRRVGDAEAAADILNQAACTTWEKWQAGQVQRPEEIGGYIFQVAMNLLRNRRRKVAERADRHVDAEVLGQLPADVDASDRWLEKKIAARVKRMLQAQGFTVYGSPRPSAAPPAGWRAKWLYARQALGYGLWRIGINI